MAGLAQYFVDRPANAEPARRAEERQLKTIVVSNQKGGVGKSTLVVHLAHLAAEQGAHVLVVDLDPQRNATYTLQDFSTGVVSSALFGPADVSLPCSGGAIDLIEADAALVDVDRAPPAVIANLRRHLERLAPRYDLCVIDTAPTAGLRMVAALNAADYVVSPIELETYSIQGITSMLQTVHGVQQRFNPKLKFVGMLPSRFNSHSPAQKAALSDLLKAHPSLVLPYAIALRTSTAESLTERVPVWRMSKTSARDAGKEMKAALCGIFERIGGVP